jgi:copper transport protein
VKRFASIVVILAALAAPAGASAHAQLEGTSPTRGAVVSRQPAAVVFRFNESVEGTFGAVRVFDARGRRVDAGDAFHPGGTGSRLAVHLRSHLARGTYTATYRVVSADGHIVSSGMVFSIGRAGVAPARSVGQLNAGARTSPVTQIAFGVARGLELLCIALGIGGIVTVLAVWLPALRAAAEGEAAWRAASEAFVARLRRAAVAVAFLGAIGAAAGVVLEAAEASGISGFSALRPHLVSEELGTRFGTAWGLAVVAWLAIAAGVPLVLGARRRRAPALRPAELGATGLAASRPPAFAVALLAVPLLVLLVVPTVAGHASTQSPRGILTVANVLHVAAVSVWLGGLAVALGVLPAATRRLGSAHRTRLLAAFLERFSPLALASVAALLVTGVVQAYVEVRTPAHLLDTAFGRSVLIKAILLLALIGLGAFQRQRNVPAMRRLARTGEPPGRPGRLLRRALRAEVALIVVVLGVTAALTSYAPSIAAQSGPVSRNARIGPAELELTADPARVGANELHLYLLDPRTGASFTRAKELQVDTALPAKRIGAQPQNVQHAGPGHYVAPGVTLGLAGTWRVRVTVRTSAFDEYQRTVEVPVR